MRAKFYEWNFQDWHLEWNQTDFPRHQKRWEFLVRHVAVSWPRWINVCRRVGTRESAIASIIIIINIVVKHRNDNNIHLRNIVYHIHSFLIRAHGEREQRSGWKKWSLTKKRNTEQQWKNARESRDKMHCRRRANTTRNIYSSTSH